MQSRFGLSGFSPEAAALAMEAYGEGAKDLGWQSAEHLSEAETQILLLKIEERAAELLLRISDASKRPSFAAVRQAIRASVFFHEGFLAFEMDRAWFSKHRDRRFRARDPLAHESQPHSAKFRQKAIVVRDQNSEGEDYPVLVLITHAHYRVDWTNETEIMQFIDCSNREIASLH
jgi:hypothetical protein